MLRIDSGGNVSLQCILGSDLTHGGSFSWTGPAVSSGRAVITLNSSRTVSVLTINGVSRSDEGEYICSYTGVGIVSITLDVICKLPCAQIPAIDFGLSSRHVILFCS